MRASEPTFMQLMTHFCAYIMRNQENLQPNLILQPGHICVGLSLQYVDTCFIMLAYTTLAWFLVSTSLAKFQA